MNLGWSRGNNQFAQLNVDCLVMVSLIRDFGESGMSGLLKHQTEVCSISKENRRN